MLRFTFAAAALAGFAAAHAQVTVFDAATNLVTIPSVSVGSASYTNVLLRHQGNYVFVLEAASAQTPAVPGVASYDVGSGVLTMPAVRVGNDTYVDVKLRDTGNYVFALQTAALLPASVSTEVAGYFRAAEDLLASAVPAAGADRLRLADGCWASNGRTRAQFIAEWDANSADFVKRDAYLIGRRYQNIQVLALRNSTNPDGSARREIDVQYDVVHLDGTVASGSTTTLIGGSSAGTPRCTTPQLGSGLRDFGNQRLVQVRVRGINSREQRYSLATGASLDPAVRFRREVDFYISDPMSNARYAIVTGTGPTNTTNGVLYPFSLKLLSPRLLRSAPELQGKNGNFVNALDDDSWRFCVLPSGAVPAVALVDCVANPGNGSGWGWGFTATADATADANFAAQGWVAGAVYRFDFYDDDGWKTVNGHVGRTPIATYYEPLERLPATFAELDGKYPLFNLGNLTGAQIAANARSATPAPLSLAWSAPGVPFTPAMHLSQVWEFHQGPKVGNPGSTFNPALRTPTRAYPGSRATSTTSFPALPLAPDQASKTYVEYSLLYVDETTGNQIRSRINFQ